MSFDQFTNLVDDAQAGKLDGIALPWPHRRLPCRVGASVVAE